MMDSCFGCGYRTAAAEDTAAEDIPAEDTLAGDNPEEDTLGELQVASRKIRLKKFGKENSNPPRSATAVDTRLKLGRRWFTSHETNQFQDYNNG